MCQVINWLNTYLVLLLPVLMLTCETGASLIYEACNTEVDCPTDVSCSKRNRGELVCLCGRDELGDSTGTRCLKAAFLDDPCEESPQCVSLGVATCSVTTSTCECVKGFTLDSSGLHCTLGFKYEGQNCSTNNCFFQNEQECASGICTCLNGTRPISPQELFAFPFADRQRQCIEDTFSLDKLTNDTLTKSTDDSTAVTESTDIAITDTSRSVVTENTEITTKDTSKSNVTTNTEIAITDTPRSDCRPSTELTIFVVSNGIQLAMLILLVSICSGNV